MYLNICSNRSLSDFSKFVVVACVSLAAGCFDAKQHSKYPDALTPEEALKTFDIDKAFNIQVYAAEPYITDPVDLTFDEFGNTYVVCMPDYPFQPGPGKEKGNIRMLADTNHDGRIDKAVIFADHLSEATSILTWKGGLIVTAAPDILYLKDTTGDFKADIREVLFTGFFKANPEAQITSLRFGIDNWIYANNRGQSGQVRSLNDTKASPLPMQGADFRFRLDRNKFELETGPGQFGQTINNWGHRFFTENSIHIQQAVIPWRYTHRHGFLKNPRVFVNISDHDPIMFQKTETPYWRQARTDARNRNYKDQHLDYVEYARDHFTGASGGTVYEGDAFSSEFYGNVFTGEVAGNLVHRDVLALPVNSPVYVAKRAVDEKDREFIASTDSWFRPVGFTVGPDGYLYVIDYYRQHIETPLSIPDSLKVDVDFYRGSDMGRIYRIIPKNMSVSVKPFINLSKLTSTQLVELLAHKNQWTRLQAQRLILERQDKSVAPLLKQMFNENNSPYARLHALYALEGIDALDADFVKQVMKDTHPGVREHGVILSEHYIECQSLQLEATKDSSARVALQATLSIGNYINQKVRDAFASVLKKYPEDPWFRKAILSSDAGSSSALLQLLINNGTFFQSYSANRSLFIEELIEIATLRGKPRELKTMLQEILNARNIGFNWQLISLKSLSKSVRSQTDTKDKKQLSKILSEINNNITSPAKDTLQSLINFLSTKSRK